MAIKPIRVLLVDDHAVVRMGFRMLLEATGAIEVVGEADTGEAALKACETHVPDVVVLDLSMPGQGGLDAAKRLVARFPKIKILVLSAHDDSGHASRALKLGAHGYLTKRSASDELTRAIQSVARGERYLDATIAHTLAFAQAEGRDSPVDLLTDREFKVFLRLARGMSVAAIAEELHLSPSTVGTHLYNIKQKLNAANAAELALIAVRHGLVD